MRRITFVHVKSKAATLLVLALAGCAATPSLPPASYREAIVGTWTTAGRRWEDTYLADGTNCVSYYVGWNTKDPKNFATHKYTWEIQDKALIATRVKPDGSVIAWTTRVYGIDFLTKDRFTAHWIRQSNYRHTLTRVPSGTEKFPCEPLTKPQPSPAS
jgi:hypothetical protein